MSIRALRRGDEYDIECWHTTHRLRLAMSVLRSYCEPVFLSHAEDCERHPDNIRNVCIAYQDRVCCSCGVTEKCVEWPEWVDDDVLRAAWDFAHQVQTKRGQHNRKQAHDAKREREAVSSVGLPDLELAP